MADVKASITNNIKREKAKEQLAEKAGKIRAQVVAGKLLSEAAESEGVDVHVSTFFDNDARSDLGEILKRSYQFRRAAFNLEEKNKVSEVIESPTQVVVMQWVDEKEPQPLSILDDLDRVKGLAETVAAEKFIETLFADVRNGAKKDTEKSFKELVGERSYIKDNHFKETNWFGSTAVPYEFDRNLVGFSEDLYPLEKGAFVENLPLSLKTRLVLARVKDKKEADLAKLEEDRFEIANQLREQEGRAFLSSYIYARNQQYDPDNKIQNQILSSFSRR